MVPVILSGGAGSRLWPASRSRQPKQLLSLVEDRTMLLMTIQRTDAVSAAGAPLIVCNEDQQSGIERELAKSGHSDAALILEPIGRNTAPATAVAALQLTADGADPILFVMPADHVIRNEQAFSEAVDLAAVFAEKGYLLTFGIDPTGPETGYGYIRFGDRLAEGVHIVEEFREKPDRATADEYLASGRYLWNSGIFMFLASRFLVELETHAPGVLDAARAALAGAERDGPVTRLDKTAFAAAPSISIDYAVMEHTSSAAVVPIHTGWSDVGSWAALWELAQHDENGNVVVGDVEIINVRDSYVRSSGRLVAAIGLDNVVIVDTPDATLVSRRDRSQDVKAIVDRLKEQGRSEVDTDGSELRSWGTFTTLDRGQGYRVRRLQLEPGATMPVQSHKDRLEHWIVTRGIARIHLGETARLVPEHESVLISAGETHQFENVSGTDALEMIEVSFGTDSGEEEG
ncbi:MAG: mannose-1-phosphate guanylyltransferase/mannose-6-phosphate isomerase [Acidimicrobiia bacterium]|nr:mannose-1-phosphate guanylyltransferase/mannose-6-phosphate isomerase [Acidimicrobiia bacterium]